MITLFKYTKLFSWLCIYYFYKDDIIEDVIIKNINDCGCVIIKFTQWIIPLLENNNEIRINKQFLNKLDTVYEGCHSHSLDYTKQVYENEFLETFDSKYEIDTLIASASMGQVYKVKDKKTNEYLAMKVLHPHLSFHIKFFKKIIQCLYFIPWIANWIHYYIPIHLDIFIRNFEQQISLVNEANNCLKFSNHYGENPFIIIPDVKKISQNILFLSYEEGTSFDKLKESEYFRSKCITLLHLFIKNNELYFNFMHGDIHKGNWKIRAKDHQPCLIIYDFGFCWNIPELIVENIHSLEKTFLEIKDKSLCQETKLQNTVDAYYLLLLKRCSKDKIYRVIQDVELSDDVTVLLSQLLSLSRKTGILMDSFLLQCLIVASQVQKYFNKYHYISGDSLVSDYYSKILPDIYSFCKCHHIFTEYSELLKEEYNMYHSKENTELTYRDFKIDVNKLKSLAID
tara:strand:- start:388 stop:1752 length:1365 start_codon:yes stop_codon:yes gene_type:complete